LARAPSGPNILFQTYIAGQLVATLLDRHFEARGVSSNDFGLLSALGIWGPITPTELAARIGMRPTTLSSALARVSELGYVERVPNPNDGRSYLVELTEEGDRAWRAGWPALGSGLARLEHELGDALEQVQEAVDRLDAAARAAIAAPVDETSISK
jgi:DNA-binding MarR family transcriptional regulator